MASEQPPPRRPRPQPDRPQFDLSQISFDPGRVRLSHMAIIGFIVGVLFHVCVVYAVLDDGSGSNASAGSNNGGGTTVETSVTSTPAASPTISPTGDRNNCNAIRGTDYRSETERQWFIRNCTGA